MPAPQISTTNANWVNCPNFTLAIPEDSVCRVAFRCYATDHNGNAAYWNIEATVLRVADGNVAFFGLTGFDALATRKTLGAALWDIRAQLGADEITFDVRGGIGQNIDWLPDTDGVFAMEGVPE